MKIGINTWVWTSPLTTAELERLAPHVKELGYDWIEFPLEGLDDFDVRRGAEVVRAEGLGVSTCAAMGPDRDLIHPDKTIRDNGIAYVNGAIEATPSRGRPCSTTPCGMASTNGCNGLARPACPRHAA